MFDIIAAFDVLEHVENIEGAIQKIKSKLVLNGYLILVVPVYDGPLGPLIRLLDKDTTHLQKHSRYFWLETIDKYLQIDDWSGIYRYLLFGRYYVHVPVKILRRWAPAIVLTARRTC
jgi:SAM-dependent methyltransferase